MTSKERIRSAIDHKQPDCVPIDFGGSFITGVHCSVVEALREHYGLDKSLVKVGEPYQMLGVIEDDLREAIGIDTDPIFPNRTMFGFVNENWKEWQTPWGQTVLVSEHFETDTNSAGDISIYPEGDRNAQPSAMMPRSGYFFDTIEREHPDFDEDELVLEDNLQEFGLMSAEEEAYWKSMAAEKQGSDKAIITHLNGTSLGDIALVPGPFLKEPKGVRTIAGWYMLTAEDPEHVQAIFDKQSRIAITNMEKLNAIAGDVIDVVVLCGTDFGTQESLFCAVPKVREIWMPYYKRMNDWIHSNTNWKVFKHSCGAVEPLIDTFIDCGFDCLNPVQCSAKGMDPFYIKEKYGDRITFWGGGSNTQQTLPFGTPEQVRQEVLERCKVFNKGGGFVFDAIHNVQALTPVENFVAMIDAVHEFNNAGV